MPSQIHFAHLDAETIAVLREAWETGIRDATDPPLAEDFETAMKAGCFYRLGLGFGLFPDSCGDIENFDRQSKRRWPSAGERIAGEHWRVWRGAVRDEGGPPHDLIVAESRTICVLYTRGLVGAWGWHQASADGPKHARWMREQERLGWPHIPCRFSDPF